MQATLSCKWPSQSQSHYLAKVCKVELANLINGKIWAIQDHTWLQLPCRMIPKIAQCYPGNLGDRMIYLSKVAQIVMSGDVRATYYKAQ